MFESKINRGRANGYAPLNGDGKVGLNYLPDVVGVAGTSGTSGVNGVNGSQGSSGANGTNGLNGTNGTSGTSPFAGVNTGSFATTGSNIFRGNQSISGNINLSGSLNISSSMIISSTVVNNGTIDALNTDLIIEGGYLILTGSSVPTSLSGSYGDMQGMVVFDNNFLYYCTSDYLPSVNNVRGQGNGSNITIPIVAGVPLNIQSTGWTITVPTNGGDVTYNITGAYYETTYWYLEIDNNYGAAAGTAMTLTNNNPLPEIWKKISLDGMVSINTGSFATTGSNQFSGSQSISGSLYFSPDGNIVVDKLGPYAILDGNPNTPSAGINEVYVASPYPLDQLIKIGDLLYDSNDLSNPTPIVYPGITSNNDGTFNIHYTSSWTATPSSLSFGKGGTWNFGLNGALTTPGDIIVSGSLNVRNGNINLSGSMYFGSGSSITETSSSIIITPAGAAAGQSLVVRQTGIANLFSDHPSGFYSGDTITLTYSPNNTSVASGSAPYIFTGCTQEQLGTSLSGSLIYNNETTKTLTWTIPALSDISGFTFEIYNFVFFISQSISLSSSGSSEQSHIHLVSGDPSLVDIYLGDDDQYVKIEKNAGDIVVGTNLNTHHWRFDTSGSLIVPGNINGADNLATTGSNTFIGNQIITGSVNIKKPIISIGQDLEGGKVAYILQSGDIGYDETLIQGIIAAESDEIQLLNFTNANAACDIKTTNGYSDWYLPSLMELDILYTNRVAIGGFTNDYYWSSSEAQALVGWMNNFTNGVHEEFAESYQGHVRAIRIFSIPNEKALNVEGDINISGSVNMIGDQTITGSLAINDVSTNFLIEGNGFGQTYLTAGGAIVLNPGYGGVEMTGANRSFKATDITADGTLLVKGSTTLGDNGADNTTITGSLNVNGNIYKNGSKQFNYGQWASLETQTGSANTAYAMKLENTDTTSGLYVGSNGSGFPTRIYAQNTGLYNLQFSAQLHTTSNEAVDFSVWFAMTGSNIANSNTDFSVEKVSGGGFQVAALNFLTPITSGSYVELYWSKTTANGELQYKGTQVSPNRPATPSVIVTVTQVA